MENVQLQKEAGTHKAYNNMLKSTVEVLSGELEEVKTAYNYIMQNSAHKVSQFSKQQRRKWGMMEETFRFTG